MRLGCYSNGVAVSYGGKSCVVVRWFPSQWQWRWFRQCKGFWFTFEFGPVYVWHNRKRPGG